MGGLSLEKPEHFNEMSFEYLLAKFKDSFPGEKILSEQLSSGKKWINLYVSGCSIAVEFFKDDDIGVSRLESDADEYSGHQFVSRDPDMVYSYVLKISSSKTRRC